MEYRILIVDEDPTTRRRYAEALVAAPPTVGNSYKISATGSPAAAQLQVTRQSYHLLIAALRSGGECLAMATRIRELYPNIRLLMIDCGAAQSDLNGARHIAARVITNAESEQMLVAVVGQLLGLAPEPAVAEADAPVDERPVATLADLHMVLDVTRRQAKAELALYSDNIGNIVAQRGDSTSIDVTALISLIAGAFVNSIEMARVLHERQTSHLSVHEGERYDIYSTNVGNTRLIALVFDKNLAQPRLGMVWLLMKRAAEQLHRMQIVEKSMDAMLSEQLSESLNLEFDRLFGNELEQAA